MRSLLILISLFILFLLNGYFFLRRFKGEKRSLWLAVSFLNSLFFLLLFFATLLVYMEFWLDSGLAYTILLLGALVFILVLLLFPLVLVVTLIITGIQVIRREGGGLAHYLSLGLGLAYLSYLILWPLAGQLNKNYFFDFIYIYLSFSFIAMVFVFILYSVSAGLNLLADKEKAYEGIIVLGSGLRDGGEITPLLAARVEKGIEAHRQNPGSLLILSGGQGSDERIAEAQAMAGYALARGVKEESLVIEDKSTSTRENLIFSIKLLKERGEKLDDILVVSTSYHVFRALLLARDLGIDCDGRGAKTRLYFSINAFIREWIAYLVMKKRAFAAFYLTSFLVMALVFGLFVLVGLATL